LPQQTNSFPLLLEKNGQACWRLLLARRLKAAEPDAAHPGKAVNNPLGESELSPKDFPGFLRPEAIKLS
jgi:hypothetical protein